MNVKYVLLGVVGLGVIFLVWWFIKDEFFTERRLPTHSMQPLNGEYKYFYEKLLLVRRESVNGPLLLKILNEDLVVRYRFDKQQVERVGVEDWHAATEKIKVCGGSFGVEEAEETGKYNTYGKYARLGAFSTEESKLAIISAAGPKGPSISLIPGLGGGPAIYGSRYLEVKNGVQPFANIRGPIRVDDESGMGLCWTKEEDSLVYFSSNTFRFSVLSLANALASGSTPESSSRLENREPAKPDLSRFTGNFRDYGIDADGDGLFEKVAIEIETETSIPGSYKFYLGLQTSDGKNVGQGAVAELKGGIESTKVLFDASEWFKEGIEGEMLITSADLDYGMGTGLELRDNFGRTQKYSRDQFKRENIVFTGEENYKLVDPDKEGRYRGLEFTVGVDVLKPGEYEFQANIYYEQWTSTADGSIDFITGRQNLRKGKNEVKLRFRGKAILKYAKAGRFQLRNFVLYEKGEKGKWVEEGMFTRHFELSEFSPE